jgi:alpha-L-fucosidase
MNRRTFLSLGPALAPALAAAQQTPREEHAAIGIGDGQAAPNFQRTRHPDAQWYPEAGLGLFIHWGISTVQARYGISWPMIAGRELGQRRLTPEEIARVIETRGWKSTTTPRQYWADAPKFNPQNYEPEKWLRAAKDAGFRYAVLTTRHHDGFALWPSAYGDFNTKNWMGGRDLVRSYADACRRVGLKVGFYYSPPDWHFTQDTFTFMYYKVKRLNPELPDVDIDLQPCRRPPQTDEQKARYAAYLRGQVNELLTNYGKVDLLWFDGKPAPLSPEEIRKLQPSILINDRAYGTGDFNTHAAERELPATRPAKDWWENCQVWARSSWAYVEEDYKPNSKILEQFVRVRAWNGNLLLNVGPMSTGDLPPVAYDRMKEFGGWVRQNGESVFGTKDAPDGESGNVPMTARSGVRYLMAVPSFQQTKLEWRGAQKPSAVTLLANGRPLTHAYRDGVLTVDLPLDSRTSLVDVVKLRLDA